MVYSLVEKTKPIYDGSAFHVQSSAVNGIGVSWKNKANVNMGNIALILWYYGLMEILMMLGGFE